MAAVGRALWGVETAPLYDSLAQLGAAEKVTILDVPCGGGVAFRALEPGQAVRYIAADPSARLIARAQRRARRRALDQIEFAVADITRLPLRSGVADVVLCHGGLEAAGDPGEALGELARCLQPGGLLTGTSFFGDEPGARARSAFWLRQRRGRALPPRRRELFAALATAGFCEATIGPQPGFAGFSARKSVADPAPAGAGDEPSSVGFG